MNDTQTVPTTTTESVPVAAPTTTPAPTGLASDWRVSLPDEIRNESSLKDIKDIPSLAKSYVHAQSLIGSRIALPKDDAKPEEWDAFYSKLGRPEAPDKYTFSEVQLPEGAKVDEELHKEFTKEFHKLGLNSKQADGLRSMFLQRQAQTITKSMEAATARAQAGEATLKGKWGEKYDANIKVAQNAIKEFLTPDLEKALNETGAGSDPRIVEGFFNIGLKMQEDTTRPPGAGGAFTPGTSSSAKAEIETLTKDAEFQKALHDRWHPKHKEAAKKWLDLFEQSG